MKSIIFSIFIAMLVAVACEQPYEPTVVLPEISIETTNNRIFIKKDSIPRVLELKNVESFLIENASPLLKITPLPIDENTPVFIEVGGYNFFNGVAIAFEYGGDWLVIRIASWGAIKQEGGINTFFSFSGVDSVYAEKDSVGNFFLFIKSINIPNKVYKKNFPPGAIMYSVYVTPYEELYLDRKRERMMVLFSPEEKDAGRYYTSLANHGVYLIHVSNY